MRFLSPLRYPGGKAKMAPFLEAVIKSQAIRPKVYAEPFAGGAGAAFLLLDRGVVDHVIVNDLNEGVAAFWTAVFDQTDRLLEAIRETPVDLLTWHRQRETYLDTEADAFDRGFATFFLNRTNHSGILSARPIGGLEQTGTWKLNARFRKEDLLQRIQKLGTFRDRITVTRMDGRALLRQESRSDTFFYVDPPYLKQGEDLYLANMTYRDHVSLASTLRAIQAQWILTYDHDERVPNELYAGLACASFSISHTAARQHVGNEYLIAPRHVTVGALDGFGPRPGEWLAGRSPQELAG